MCSPNAANAARVPRPMKYHLYLLSEIREIAIRNKLKKPMYR